MGKYSSKQSPLISWLRLRGESRQLLLKKGWTTQRLKPYSPTWTLKNLLEITDSLPDRLVDIALKQMGQQQREYYQQGIVYDDDVVAAGSTMNFNSVSNHSRIWGLRLLKKSTQATTDMVYF